MKTIAIISQKGGSGKTTMAVNLAVASGIIDKYESATLIDLDPQCSAAKWGDRRDFVYPCVVSAQAPRLGKEVEKARAEGSRLVVIDTAPHSETNARKAAELADLVLIPCRPSLLDLESVEDTVALLKLVGKPGVFLLTACVPQRSLIYEAERFLKGYGLPICPVTVGERIAFMHAINDGLSVMEFDPKGKAAFEVKQLYKWISKHPNMQNSKYPNIQGVKDDSVQT